MKKIVAVVFVVMVMMMMVVGASAQATFWVPDDGNTNYPNYTIFYPSGSFDMNSIDGSEKLGLFDNAVDVTASTTPSYLPLLPSTSTSVTVAFAYSGSSWTASSEGNTILLGDSNIFQLGFYDGSNWMTDISYVGGNSVYTMSFDADNYVTQADANPVPIPPSAAMLFFGFLGLVGVRRMRRDS